MLPKYIIVHFQKLALSNRKIPKFCNAKWWYDDIFKECKCKHKCKYDTLTTNELQHYSLKSLNNLRYNYNNGKTTM